MANYSCRMFRFSGVLAFGLSGLLEGCGGEHTKGQGALVAPSPPAAVTTAVSPAPSPAASATPTPSSPLENEEIVLTSEDVPSSARTAPAATSAPPDPTAGGDRGTVARKAQKRLRARYREVRDCYDQAYLKNAKLAGTVVFRFTLLPTGGVSQPENVDSTLSDSELLRCISNVIVQTKFDPFDGKGIRLVFPLKFVPPASPSR